jgi:hypothetical protein
MNYILDRLELTSIIKGIEVKKLSSDMEFISMCLHHYKDMNSIYLLYNGSLKLSLFCDIYYYIINNADKLNITGLFEASEKLKVTPYLYYCIYHTNLIFGDEKLNPFLKTFKTVGGEKLLNSFGLNDKESKEWSIPFYERLFNSNFIEMFLKQLTVDDLKKIKINHEMMQ